MLVNKCATCAASDCKKCGRGRPASPFFVRARFVPDHVPFKILPVTHNLYLLVNAVFSAAAFTYFVTHVRSTLAMLAGARLVTITENDTNSGEHGGQGRKLFLFVSYSNRIYPRTISRKLLIHTPDQLIVSTLSARSKEPAASRRIPTLRAGEEGR